MALLLVGAEYNGFLLPLMALTSGSGEASETLSPGLQILGPGLGDLQGDFVAHFNKSSCSKMLSQLPAL